MNNNTAASAATMLVAGLALILMLLWVSTAAPAANVCLSKKDARQLWPKQHIYWYSKHHCWSNRRGPPRNLKMDPVVNSLARARDVEDKCCWPILPRDSDGKIIEPPPTFSERWQTILSVFRKWWPQ